MELTGLHHVTAVTGDPSANVYFYTQVLGLRLVKKTVNQDDTAAYHLFYGDATGSAGTEVTFFDWPHAGPNLPGAGTIAQVALRVPSRAAVEWWAGRLSEFGVTHAGVSEIYGRAALAFADPEGQRLLLVDDGGLGGYTPWERSPVPAEYAIGGLYAVTIWTRQRESTALVLTQAMGFREAGVYPLPGENGLQVTVFALGEGGAGREVHVVERTDLPLGRVGIGGVHHVAFRVPDDTSHQQWQRHLTRIGVPATPVIDRFYFKSIYFREPGGALFEIATDGPGFATDEDVAHLGEKLALPPFLENQRASIEAGLRPISASVAS